MIPHNSFDIKHQMLRFDSQRVRHKKLTQKLAQIVVRLTWCYHLVAEQYP